MTASISPFAQEDVVRAIIEWVNPIVEDKILLKIKSQLSEEEKKSWLFWKINTIIQNNKWEYSSKVIDSIIHLPLSELWETAETLINLTSFKRRVTMENETVWWDTDVAIISKSDGFIWKKRKHYFDKELNYQYFKNNI
jgi:hypothetical protein